MYIDSNSAFWLEKWRQTAWNEFSRKVSLCMMVSDLLNSDRYFFAAAASSSFAFVLFSLTPTNLASLLASRNVL